MSIRELTSEEIVINEFRDLVENVLVSRSELINKFLDPRRDVMTECGHPTTEEITPELYKLLWERSPIGNRVVGLMPSQCWAHHPNLYEDEDPEVETEFELAWKAICRRIRGNSKFKETEGSYGTAVWEMMKRVDELSGVGQYGVILVGFDDIKVSGEGGEVGKTLRDPVDGVEEYFSRDPNEDLNKKKSKKKPTKTTKTGTKTETKSEEVDTDEVEDTTEVGAEEETPTVKTPKFKPRNNVLFLRAFEQTLAQVTQYETDKGSPRYGRPKEYLLTFNDPNNQPIGGAGVMSTQEHVHWTRIIHVAENNSSSLIFGTPRMRPVYNNILDLMKLHGGSAEMYWRGAFPGFALETHPQLGGDVVVDSDAIKAQMQNYMNKLQRYIALMGMTAKSLAPQVSDPTAQIEVQLDAICIQLGCPKRIFMGSERGELASTQDEGSWTEVVEERQKNHCIPNIVCPMVDLFIAAGALPEPEEGYCCEWEDTETVSELDEATIAGAKTDAMSKYVSGGVDALMSPKDWLTLVLKLTDSETESVLKNAVEHINEANPEAEDVTVPGQHPKPPAPELPPSPIKMKDGETLVAPDGSPLPGKIPAKKPIPPQFVKNADLDSEVLDEEEDFFYPSGEVRNFNPSQPRDSQGRWGSGGSGGVSPNISKTLSGSSFDAFSKAQDKNKFIQEHLTAVARDLGLKTEIKVLSDPEFNAVVVADAARMGASAHSVSAAYKAKSDVAHFRASNISRIKEKGDLRLFLDDGYHELGHAYETHVLGKTITGETSQRSYDNSAREDFANTFSSRLGIIRKKNIGETVKSRSALSTEDHLYVGDVSSYAVNAKDALESTGRQSSTNIPPDWYTGSTANPVVSDVANYSPSQPRDARGRFGSGGGGGGGGSSSGEQGPPQSFKDFATAEEKKELNKLAKKRLELNKKVKDGTATQAERVEAVMVKKRIAELKEIADKRSKGADVKPTPKPEVKPEVKPDVKPDVETPKPVDSIEKPTPGAIRFQPDGYAGNIKEVLASHPELNDLHSKILEIDVKSAALIQEQKILYTQKTMAFRRMLDHYDQNRGKPGDRHPEGWDDDKIKAYLAESNSLEKEHEEIQTRYHHVQKKVEDTFVDNTKAAHKLLALPEEKRIKIKGSETITAHVNSDGFIDDRTAPGERVNKKIEKKAEQAREFIESLTNKRTQVGTRSTLSVKLKTTTDDRSYHNGTDTGGSIYIGISPRIGVDTHVHEYAHAVEKQVPGMLTRSKAFLEARIRAAKTRSVSMRDKYGKSFDSSEIGNEDSFKEAFGSVRSAEYCGKWYKDATEVISMGTEKLYQDPVGFAQKDPEFFKFVVGSLRGSF